MRIDANTPAISGALDLHPRIGEALQTVCGGRGVPLEVGGGRLTEVATGA